MQVFGSVSLIYISYTNYVYAVQHQTGDSGIKVNIFSMSMDTVGRHELLGISVTLILRSSFFICLNYCITHLLIYLSGLQSFTSYDGACPICRHQWTEGLIGTQCCFAGYRTFLPPGSRGRRAQFTAGGHTYEYGGVEARRKAPLRSVRYARDCLAMVEAVGQPVGGHKTAPLIARLPGFDWFRMSPNELMHDSKILVEMFLKCIVGKVAGSAFYNSWCYDIKHRREAQMMGIFRQIWPDTNGPLPWRLTTQQRKLLDTRMVRPNPIPLTTYSSHMHTYMHPNPNPNYIIGHADVASIHRKTMLQRCFLLDEAGPHVEGTSQDSTAVLYSPDAVARPITRRSTRTQYFCMGYAQTSWPSPFF